MRAGAATVITAYGTPLASVSSFKYLERVMSALENNWTVVVRNLKKAQHKWAWLTWVLGKEGSDDRTLGRFYVAVFQTVLLYGSEIWVMAPRIGENLRGFHHRVA